MSMRLAFHSMAIAALLCADVALAGPTASFAIVIGNNASPDAERRALRYADDDAVQYARLFEELGIETVLLVTLDEGTRRLHPSIAPRSGPSRAAIRAALSGINQQIEALPAGAQSQLYIVYSGHGDVHHGEGFVTLADGRLSREDLFDEILARSRATTNHVILDSCKSYFLVFDRGSGEERIPYRQRFDHRSGLVRFANTGFMLSTSSAQNSHEWEGFQAGVFSHEVRSGIRGGADLDVDGRITYRELAAFIYAANQGIRNERYRPRFVAIPPDNQEHLLEFESGQGRELVLDKKNQHRLYVEDQDGNRLADVRLGQAEIRLVLPETLLFVRDLDADVEYRLEGAGVQRHSALQATPPRSALRGSEDEAFRQLFGHALSQASFEAVERSGNLLDRQALLQRADEEEAAGVPPIEGPTPSELPVDAPAALRPWAWATLGLAVAAAAGSGAAGIMAKDSFDAYRDRMSKTSLSDRDLSREVDQRRTAANVLAGIAAASAATSLVLFLVEATRGNGEADKAGPVAIVPGFGAGQGALVLRLRIP